MSTMRKLTTVLMALLILIAFAGCKKKEKVGTEELLNVKEQEQKERLGEILNSPIADASPSPAALGAQPEVNQQQKQQQQQQQQEAQTQVFELTLIGDHPYYEPEQNIQVRSGTILRITNKDDQPRRYASNDGTYDSKDIPPGRSVDVAANTKGEFTIVDDHLPFATAYLQVY